MSQYEQYFKLEDHMSEADYFNMQNWLELMTWTVFLALRKHLVTVGLSSARIDRNHLCVVKQLG
jgi:hypothetical protein